MRRATLLFLGVFLSMFWGSVFADINYDLQLISSSNVNLYTGQSTQATIRITNNNWITTGHCTYRVDSGSWSTWFTVGTGAPVDKSVTLNAPSMGSGSGSVYRTITTACYDDGDQDLVYKSVNVLISYTENPDYIRQQDEAKKASNALDAINSAKTTLDSADSVIKNAETAVTNAKNLGADVSNAELKLTNARTAYQNAVSKYNSAVNYYNSKSYDLAISTAKDATTYADTAKTYANDAIALANAAKQIAISAQTGASTAINNAKNAIDSANSAITSAQTAISNAKIIVTDISSATILLDTARSKLTLASSKYNDAVSQFDSLKWDTAKQYASQAEAYAIDAQTNAKNAESTAVQAKEKKEKELREAQLKLETERSQAQSKLSEAQTTYDNVVSAVDQTNKMLSRASEMKIDTSSFSKELEKVTSTIIDAKGEINKAKKRYDNKEYAESKKSSSASLDITEKHVTIIQNIQYATALAAKEAVAKRHSTITSLYSSAFKTFEDEVSKAKITVDVYSSRKQKLEKAKAHLNESSNLIAKGGSYLNAKNYYDAINSYRNAYSELNSAESLSTEIKSSITAEPDGGAVGKEHTLNVGKLLNEARRKGYLSLGVILFLGVVAMGVFLKLRSIPPRPKERRAKGLEARPIETKEKEPVGAKAKGISVVGLSKSYKKSVILENVAFEIDQGTLCGIVGSSGGGKSTLIEGIAGRTPPDKGEIRILGIDTKKDRMKINQLVGFVPQHPELYLDQTVWQNMMNSALKWSVKDAEAKSEKILKQLDIYGRKDVIAKNLSGGQLKRLSLGMELIREPQILVLDEPTTGLDPTSRDQILTALSKVVTSEKRTAVFTTHFMDEAEHCDEVIIVGNAQILAKGPPSELARKMPGGGRVVNITLEEVSENLVSRVSGLEGVRKVIREGRVLKMIMDYPDPVTVSQKVKEFGGVIEEAKIAKAGMKEVFVYYTGVYPEDVK